MNATSLTRSAYIRIFTDRPISPFNAVFQSGALRATPIYRSQKRHIHKEVTEKAPARTWIFAILVHSLVNGKKLFSRLSQFNWLLLNTCADSMRCGSLLPVSHIARDPRKTQASSAFSRHANCGCGRKCYFFRASGLPREFRNGRFSGSSRVRTKVVTQVVLGV